MKNRVSKLKTGALPHTMKYWEIIDSFDHACRWYLGDPETAGGIQLDARLFTEGQRYGGQKIYPVSQSPDEFLKEGSDYGIANPLKFRISHGANPLAFTLGAFDIPVVTERIAEHLQACCGDAIQLIPAMVCSDSGRYEILNVLKIVEAIDETHSEISWRIKQDSLGKTTKTYAGIGRLVLKSEKMNGISICRLKDWEIALVVSDNVKNILEELKTTGIGFEELATV